MNNVETSDQVRVADSAIRTILKSQYHASLAMLGEAIEKCPDDLWLSDNYVNAFWQVAYHTLFFTHFYLGIDSESFQPWPEHQANVQHPDGIGGPPDPESSLPLLPDPYTKAQVLDYWNICNNMVDDAIDAMDINSPESGFYWYKAPKLEHQLINIRHIQHGAAQLADRLRGEVNVGVSWAGARRK
ncbi:MAG: DinB family protein [Candidatus Kapaibacterium sp.]